MKPILFNTEMVKAILEGRKTVTRRLIKPRYREGEAGFNVCRRKDTGEVLYAEIYDEEERGVRRIAPPFEVGDVLYVRETWNFVPCIDCGAHLYGMCNETPVIFEDSEAVSEGCFIYKADYSDADAQRHYWRPSIHMPKKAARLFLRVTKVSVQPLQWCGNAQAKDEGCRCCSQFVRVWDSTIKPTELPQYGWEANPWVWVIEFQRCERTEE